MQWFDENKDFYHPVAATSIEAILGIEEVVEATSEEPIVVIKKAAVLTADKTYRSMAKDYAEGVKSKLTSFAQEHFFQ